jgi:uncharacterized membrane protein YfcA
MGALVLCSPCISVGVCSVVASTLGTLTGFGIGLGFVLALSLLTPTLLTPISNDEHLQWVISAVGLLTCGMNAIENRRHVPLRWVLHLLAPTILLSPLGVLLALGFQTGKMKQVFAWVFFAAGSQQLWANWTAHRPRSPTSSPVASPREGAAQTILDSPFERVLLVGAGAASGFLGGLSGMGGPPMQVYIVARPIGLVEGRAGISAYFTLIYVANLLTLLSARLDIAIADEALRASLFAAVAGVAVGSILGRLLLRLNPDAELIYTTITALLFLSCAEEWAGALAGVLETPDRTIPMLFTLVAVGAWVIGLYALHGCCRTLLRGGHGACCCCCHRPRNVALH